MNCKQAFAQGARCGHIEGGYRVGLYITHEELKASWVAANAQHFESNWITDKHDLCKAWELGYQHGYLRAVDSLPLEPEYQ